MKKFKTVEAFMKAYNAKGSEIPSRLLSPGGAAQELGVTRQAIHNRMYVSKSLDFWETEDGYVFISLDSVEKAKLTQRSKKSRQEDLPLEVSHG